MSTSASIKKIKISSLNSNALPRKRASSDPTLAENKERTDVLVEVAKLLARKYKILSKWDNSRMGLFVALKTKSESKCMVELYRLCKKSLKSKQSSTSEGREEKPKVTKTIFREMKKNKNSSKKKTMLPARKKKMDEGQEHEHTITESAQRSV